MLEGVGRGGRNAICMYLGFHAEQSENDEESGNRKMIRLSHHVCTLFYNRQIVCIDPMRHRASKYGAIEHRDMAP